MSCSAVSGRDGIASIGTWLAASAGVGHGAVRVVANVAILANRLMLEGKRALLFRMTLVAQQVDGRLLEVLLVSYCPCGSWQSEQTILPSLIG